MNALATSTKFQLNLVKAKALKRISTILCGQKWLLVKIVDAK